MTKQTSHTKFCTVPSDVKKTYGFAAVDTIRDRLLKLDYVKHTDPEALRVAHATAARSNEIEGLYRPPEEVAFHEMLFDMLVPPGPLFRQCTRWYLEMTMGRTLDAPANP